MANINDIFNKIDQKVLKTKLNNAIDSLKNESPEELKKKISKIDKNMIMDKLNEIDESKLKELNIDKNELKKKISNEDINKLAQAAGKEGDMIIKKLKEVLK